MPVEEALLSTGKQTADGSTKSMCRNRSGQLTFEVRARSGYRQGGTDPAEELRHFDVLLLRYLQRVNSELRKQSVNVSSHQIYEGADSGAPSLNNIFPTGTLSFGNPPGLFGFIFSFFSIFLGLLQASASL